MTDQNKQPNSLQHLTEFERLLKDYSPSRQSVDLFRSIPLLILVGPTAAGRNTLINILTATGRYKMVVSDTTRNKRLNNGVLEQDGREYWFKSEEQVLDGLKQGEYIEAAVIHKQQVSGAHINEFEAARRSGLVAVKEIEPNGADMYVGFNPSLLAIFLLPPSFDVWMERLRGRGNMTEEELIRRMRSAQDEIDIALTKDYYHFVINNEIHEAAQAVDELAGGRQPNADKQRLGRDHAEQLALDVQLYLNKRS